MSPSLYVRSRTRSFSQTRVGAHKVSEGRLLATDKSCDHDIQFILLVFLKTLLRGSNCDLGVTANKTTHGGFRELVQRHPKLGK